MASHESNHLKEAVQSIETSGAQPYQCRLCNVSYMNRQGLDLHMKEHSEEKPYRCMFCQRSYLYKSTLTNHTRTHTGEKPFKCKSCGRCFALRCTLNKHAFDRNCRLKTLITQKFVSATGDNWVSGSAGASRHQEDIVSEVFPPWKWSYWNNQSTSVFTINPYGCGVCGEMFAVESEFIQHCWNHKFASSPDCRFLFSE